MPGMDAASLVACGFDAVRYVERFPDLVAVGMAAPAGAQHFLDYGVHEGRNAPIDCSLATFERNVRDVPAPNADAVVRRAAEWLSVHRLNPPCEENLLLQHVGGSASFRPLLVIGDSHIRAYCGQEAVLNAGYLTLPLLCGAGSAQGLVNPVSRAGYGRKIRLFLQDAALRLSRAKGVLLFKFGQVDVEFVHPFKRIQLQEFDWDWPKALSRIDECVAAYLAFLLKVRPALPRDLPVAVCSIFPPVLNDEEIRKGYTNDHVSYLNSDQSSSALALQLRKFRFPDLAGRTRLHGAFNDRLRTAAGSAGLAFVDDFTDLLSGETAERSLLELHGGADHHIDPRSPALARALGHVLRRLPGPGPGAAPVPAQ